MDNLYYVPINLVENVLFEELGNSIGIELINGENIPLQASNSELEKYYKHYYVNIQNQSKNFQVDDDYKIPLGVLFDEDKAVLINFDDFKKEFDATHLSRIDEIYLNIDGEQKEFFLIQVKKELLEDSLFNNDEIDIDLGKWKVNISIFTIPIIISSLSKNDEKAILAYEKKGVELEFFGLLLEPDFDNPAKTELTLKKI